MSALLARLPVIAGRTVRSLPGVIGATAIAVGAGFLGGLAVGLIVGGGFCLLLDREM